MAKAEEVMDIEINVYATVICYECGSILIAEVSRNKDKQTIIVKPCDHCMDEAAKDAL